MVVMFDDDLLDFTYPYSNTTYFESYINRDAKSGKSITRFLSGCIFIIHDMNKVLLQICNGLQNTVKFI